MAHYVGLGKYFELPCYGRSLEIEGNDKYIQFPQKNAVKNIKIMYFYLLKRKIFLKYFFVKDTGFRLFLGFVFFLSGFYHDNVNPGFYPDSLVSRKLFLGERTFSALFTTLNKFPELTGPHPSRSN